VFVRWEGQSTEHEAERRLPGLEAGGVVRTFDAPEALGIEFMEVEAKSALNHVAGEGLPFSWTVNPYRGCTHACAWCFARPTHTFLGLNAREDFERKIVVKVNAPERLRAELARPSWKGEMVALGTNTDLYQWVEGRYRLTRAIWEVLIEARNPGSVLTKSPLLTRDIDLFRELHDVAGFQASLSIPTLDERAWRATEPATPHPRKRIEAVAELSEAGIPVGVLVAPIQPGINDSPEQIEEIVGLCTEAGADSIGGIGLHLKGEVREIFLDWLRDHRPDLLDRYEDLYAGGAFLPGAERSRIQGLVTRATRKAGGTHERSRAAKRRREVIRVTRRRLPARRRPSAEAEEVSPQSSLF
jgi:DNA repair photolyase